MKIVTSLSFQGQCREAFEFYARVLGGRITSALTYAEAPPDMPGMDASRKDWLMHCWLEVGDQALMGADVSWAPDAGEPRGGFDVTLHTDDLEQGRRWYEGLAEGGRQTMPFAETFWSPGFGGLVDRFGVPWMVNTLPAEGSEQGAPPG